MIARLKKLILRLLNEHRVMAIATNRPDGWPQSTLVGYINDGFLLYCYVARNAQKYANVLRDPRVSISIGSDAVRPLDIKGLSLAGSAFEVTDPWEVDHVAGLQLKRYPEYAEVPAPVVKEGAAQRISSPPPTKGVVLLRIEPNLVSVLDYSRGFGHSDLVAFSARDLDQHVDSLRHLWDG